MNIEKFKVHLHMFDGAGEGGTASADGSAPSEDGEKERARVEYGRSPETPSNDHVGDDHQEPEAKADPDKEFEELIKGRFKDQYAQRVQSAIQTRFKNNQDNEKLVDRYRDATSILYQRYGLEDDDIEGLEYAISHDEGLFAAEAEAEGLTVQKYMEMQRQQAEAERAKSMLAAMQQEQEKQQFIAQLEAEAEELKEIFPNFDLAMESENEEFREKINKGYSVRDAFLTAHMGDILNGGFDMARQEEQTRMVQQINQRQSRPPENASRSTPSVVRKADPSKWTDEDMDEVERRVYAGERIVL